MRFIIESLRFSRWICWIVRYGRRAPRRDTQTMLKARYYGCHAATTFLFC